MNLNIENFGQLSPVVTLVAAIIAITVAVAQIAYNRRAQAEKLAYDAYQSFLNDCLENPRLASGQHVIIPPKDDWKAGDEDFHKYEWLVAKMLSASEQILAVTKSDENWTATIEHLLKLHEEFLRSDHFKPEIPIYSAELQRLLKEALGAG